LESTLASLGQQQRIAFAAACSERLLPNYAAFVQVEGWGDLDALARVHEALWIYAAHGNLGSISIEAMFADVQAAVPDVKNYSTVYATLALYATAALVNAFHALLQENVDGVVHAATYGVESVKQFLLVCTATGVGPRTVDRDWETWLELAPLLLAERAKQETDLQLLHSQPNLTPDFIREFRASNELLGIRPLERGLVKLPTSPD